MLPILELEWLSQTAHVVRHVKGDVLYNEGDECAYAWLLQEGQIQMFKYNSDVRPFAIEAIQPNQLFGTLDRLGITTAWIYPCTAVACTDSVSIKIPDRIFQTLYSRHPAMVASVCRLCSERLFSMQQRALLYLEPVERRLVKVLVHLCQANGVELPYTRREISELAGTTVETVIRILSKFKKRRWISSTRGKLRLTDLPRLQNYLGNDLSFPHGGTQLLCVKPVVPLQVPVRI